MMDTLSAVRGSKAENAQLLDCREPERAPGRPRDLVFDGNVQSDLAQSPRSAPARTFVEESLQDTHPPLARNDVRRGHVAVRLREQQGRAKGVHAAQNSDRLSVALSQQDHLVRRGEMTAVDIARALGGIGVQPLEQRVVLMLPQQREAERDDSVEVARGGWSDSQM